jgi:hypothetical protein
VLTVLPVLLVLLVSSGLLVRLVQSAPLDQLVLLECRQRFT